MENDFILAEQLSYTVRSEVGKMIPKTIKGYELQTRVSERPSYEDDDMHIMIKVICPELHIYESCSFAVNLYKYSVDNKKTIALIRIMISSMLEKINEKEK